jgi:hypothetical protein
LREKGVATVFSGSAVPEKKNEGGAVGEDDPDAWGRVVSKKRKKKEKGRRGGCGGLLGLVLGWPSRVGSRAAALLDPRCGLVALFLFFCSDFFFYFSVFIFVLFEISKLV